MNSVLWRLYIAILWYKKPPLYQSFILKIFYTFLKYKATRVALFHDKNTSVKIKVAETSTQRVLVTEKNCHVIYINKSIT